MKTPTKARVIFHGEDHSQYFPGHGLWGTTYKECATGIGTSEKQALDDALEQLAQNDWDIDALCALDEFKESAGDVSEKEIEQHHDEWWLWVSVDVA
jgi:hypothetical protein